MATRKFCPPAEIKAYDTKTCWPPYWDRLVMARLLVDAHACRIIHAQWRTRDDLGVALLEKCLGMRSAFQTAPKVSSCLRKAQVKQIADTTRRLIALLGTHQAAAASQCVLPLTIECLYPERYAVDSWTSAFDPLPVVDVLQLLADKMDVATSNTLPARPGHPNALRTYTAQSLMRLFLHHGPTGSDDPCCSDVAVLTNMVIGNPAQLIDANHVAKLKDGSL